MEQYLIYQVRINLIQQSLVSFNPASDSDRTDNTVFSKISSDIITLCHEIMNTNNDALMAEFIPQIENLCVILNTKKPFM